MRKTKITKPNGMIEAQDVYIREVVGLNPRCRNYYVHLTKAGRKFKARLGDFGFNASQQQTALQDAHEVACFERFLAGNA